MTAERNRNHDHQSDPGPTTQPGVPHRIPFDIDAYTHLVQSRPCFICALVAGEHDSQLEQIIADDGENFAYLTRYPTLFGYVLVSPKAHHEHVIRDLTEDTYLRLMAFVYRVAHAVEQVVPSERTYVLSLGSQQGNAHVHWHIAPLPPGIPLHEQQFHALMIDNGVLPWTLQQSLDLAGRLRAALESTYPISTPQRYKGNRIG